VTATPRAVVVIGVSGAGKTEIGSAVAQRLGRLFIDADDLHPAANKTRMAQSWPLEDVDRMPWLDAVAAAAAGSDVVIACSALRRRYRERLLNGMADAVFVQRDVSREQLERRVQQRSHELMPLSLLDSQLATLEPLAPDEPGLRISADKPVADVVDAVVDSLQSTH
jgi:gluconokinase